MCPDIHTEPLSKDWRTHGFQVFEEITVQLLAEHQASQAEVLVAIHNTKYRLYTISLEKLLKNEININKQKQQQLFGRGRENDFKSYQIILFKMPTFQQKIETSKKKKKIQESMAHT